MDIQKLLGVTTLINWTLFIFTLQLPEVKSDVNYAYYLFLSFPVCVLSSLTYVQSSMYETLRLVAKKHNPKSWAYKMFTAELIASLLLTLLSVVVLIFIRTDYVTALTCLFVALPILMFTNKITLQLSDDLNQSIASLEIESSDLKSELKIYEDRIEK